MSIARLLATPAAAVLAAALCLPALAQAQTNAATTIVPVIIAAGNTFQQVLPVVGAPPETRRSLTIQNNQTTTDNCWVYLGPTASATKGTSILLTPGQAYTRYYPYVPSDNIAATCATTADTLYVDVQ